MDFSTSLLPLECPDNMDNSEEQIQCTERDSTRAQEHEGQRAAIKANANDVNKGFENSCLQSLSL